MFWYKSLSKEQKLGVRKSFELATGISLNNAIIFFSFSECMDILYTKLKIEGFQI